MTLYEKMVDELHPQNKIERENAQREVMQEIVLAGLFHGGFFKHAAFYGGTCLRIFHDLRRFSEDMDFTQTEKNPDVHLEDYFKSIIETFKLTGREVTIKKKDILSPLRRGGYKAGFKDNTDVYDIAFQTEKTPKVKIELDTNPPLGFLTEEKMLVKPYSSMVRCVSLPDLFAGKMHALLLRNWKTRVKGRDWYDFEWYVRNRIPLNFAHLQKRISEFNGIEMSMDDFLETLRQRLSETDISVVKEDVLRYVFDESELDIWSNDYFLKLADMIVYKE